MPYKVFGDGATLGAMFFDGKGDGIGRSRVNVGEVGEKANIMTLCDKQSRRIQYIQRFEVDSSIGEGGIGEDAVPRRRGRFGLLRWIEVEVVANHTHCDANEKGAR